MADDLGDPGWDPYLGYGRVNAYRAVSSAGQSFLAPTPTPPPATPTPVPSTMHVGDLDGSKALSRKNWKATGTIYVHDTNDNPLVSASVSGSCSGGYTATAAATTDSSGKCRVTTGTVSNSKASVTFQVTKVTCSISSSIRLRSLRLARP